MNLFVIITICFLLVHSLYYVSAQSNHEIPEETIFRVLPARDMIEGDREHRELITTSSNDENIQAIPLFPGIFNKIGTKLSLRPVTAPVVAAEPPTTTITSMSPSIASSDLLDDDIIMLDKSSAPSSKVGGAKKGKPKGSKRENSDYDDDESDQKKKKKKTKGSDNDDRSTSRQRQLNKNDIDILDEDGGDTGPIIGIIEAIKEGLGQFEEEEQEESQPSQSPSILTTAPPTILPTSFFDDEFFLESSAPSSISNNLRAKGSKDNKKKKEKKGNKKKSSKDNDDDDTIVYEFINSITSDALEEHLLVFQNIAETSNPPNTRALGTEGYDRSVQYIKDTLEDVGYDVQLQPFPVYLFNETSTPELAQVRPIPTIYEPNIINSSLSFAIMAYSAQAGVTAPAQPVPGLGCDIDDYIDFIRGNIAIITRGECQFATKVDNAVIAGAVGVIIYNDGEPGREYIIFGTLREPKPIPVLFASYQLGLDLSARDIVVGMITYATTTLVETENVIAEMITNDDDDEDEHEEGDHHHDHHGGGIVITGAHLDSVIDGPGISDNGSGSAAILEMAIQMSKLKNNYYNNNKRTRMNNRIRFIWWGAEEVGLIGSNYYVENISDEEQSSIITYINQDMIASPNGIRDISLTTTSTTPSSNETTNIGTEYFDMVGIPYQLSEPSFRTDTAAFIFANIPTINYFTGAEGIKTYNESIIYGGIADEQYDPCYHTPCDTINNINITLYNEMTKAAAYTLYKYATTMQDAITTTPPTLSPTLEPTTKIMDGKKKKQKKKKKKNDDDKKNTAYLDEMMNVGNTLGSRRTLLRSSLLQQQQQAEAQEKQASSSSSSRNVLCPRGGCLY